jgi:pilus assembly protein CpaD
MWQARPSARILAVGLLALALTACKHADEHTRVAGWELVDPAQRHPILVSQQPETLNVEVPRSSHGLSPSQRADVLAFAHRSEASDAGNSRLVISAPSGSANETSAIQAVQEIGILLRDNGIPETSMSVEPFDAEGHANPPVKVSFLRYVAEGPECGFWPTNLAREPRNLPMPNLGCAQQKNLAAMIANPADLVTPRSMTARPSERRLVTWEKYVKGEATGAQKSGDERVKTDGE